MKRKIWIAVASLALVLTFLLIYFNYDSKDKEMKNGILVQHMIEGWELAYEK